MTKRQQKRRVKPNWRLMFFSFSSCILLGTVVLLWQNNRSVRLEVAVGSPFTTYETSAGGREATLVLTPRGNSSGPVTIQISVEGVMVGNLDSFYNYTAGQNTPAGILSFHYMDEDWRLDPVIETSGFQQTYYISSQSGRVQRVEN
jgi:hypothetical protein